MSGLYGAMQVAKSGLAVTSLGVRATSHNIANVNTPNYSRQRQEVATEFPIATSGGYAGAGVRQVATQRATDPFIQEQLLRHGGQLGASSAQTDALALIEQIVGDAGPGGLGAALGAFYDAWSDLASASAPGAALERSAVRSSAEALVEQLHALDRQLRDQMAALDQQIQGYLPRVNDLLAQLDTLNDEIARLEVTHPANDLRDQRDGLLRELGGLLDITVREDADRRVDVSLRNGVPLVTAGRARTLFAAPDPTHPIDPRFVRVFVQDGLASSDITPLIGSGQLGGLLAARDVTLAGALRSLDVLAFNLSSTVNAVHATGLGANGASGDFFSQPAQVADAARDLDLTAAILASPDAIAAGPSGLPGDNRTAQAIAALRDARAPLHVLGDTLGAASGPQRSVLEEFSAVISEIGVQAQSAQSHRAQLERVMETLENRRDEVAGVSLDEEVTRLVELQAAFQANSRVIKLVSDLLGELVDTI
jgi:flagellar hook-associated protein 1 FlgK